MKRVSIKGTILVDAATSSGSYYNAYLDGEDVSDTTRRARGGFGVPAFGWVDQYVKTPEGCFQEYRGDNGRGGLVTRRRYGMVRLEPIHAP